MNATIHWIPVTEALPDDELSVLLALSDGEVEPGFHEAGEWFFLSAGSAEEGHVRLTHWAHYPASPISISTPTPKGTP